MIDGKSPRHPHVGSQDLRRGDRFAGLRWFEYRQTFQPSKRRVRNPRMFQ